MSNIIMNNYSLVVFCPLQFYERLKLSFMAASKKYSDATKNSVDVIFASTLEELLRYGGANVADYIAVFVDTRDGNNILRCQQYLRTITAHFVVTRLCIVNGSCRSGLLTAAKELISLGDQFRIPIINAEVGDDVSCELVSKKLIKLGAKVTGVTYGMPIVIPTPQDIEAYSNSVTQPRISAQQRSPNI